jgi:hypothetical protein
VKSFSPFPATFLYAFLAFFGAAESNQTLEKVVEVVFNKYLKMGNGHFFEFYI